MNYAVVYKNELAHHGVKGQEWGVRRWQYEDGSLTPAGYPHYGIGDGNKNKKKEKPLSQKKFQKEILKLQKQPIRTEDYLDNDGRIKPEIMRAVDQLCSKYIEKYEDLVSNGNRYSGSDSYKKSGVKVGDTYDTISKDSKIQRIGTDDSEFSSKNMRKYASILDYDNDTYKEDYYTLPSIMESTEDAKVYTYKATKDLKVAKGEEVATHIIEQYGDKSYKVAYDNVRSIARFADDINFKAEHDRDLEAYKISNGLKKLLKNDSDKLGDLFYENLYTSDGHANEIFNHFSKLGYDAVVDVEDQTNGIADYPIILLDPKKSVTLESSREI